MAKADKKDKENKKKGKDEPQEPEEQIENRLLTRYQNEVVPALKEHFGYTNPMVIPRLRKVVINMGIGQAVENKKRLESAVKELGTITGQKPIITKARKSVAGFKLREGYPIGCSVTLRRRQMWEFVDRLTALAIPRIRDFRGLPVKLDGRGNYTMGLSEQSVFPEIDLDRIEFAQGMNITFVTNAKTDQEGLELLKLLGMPFRKEGEAVR